MKDDASRAVETSEPTNTQTPAYRTAEAMKSSKLKIKDSGLISIVERIGARNALSRLAKTRTKIGTTSTAIWTRPSTSNAMIFPTIKCFAEIEVRIISLMRFSFSSTTTSRKRLPQSAIKKKKVIPIKNGMMALPSALESEPSTVSLLSTIS